MSIPNTFIEWVNSRVQELQNVYGMRSKKHAFATWVVGYIHELSDDDAFEQTDTLYRGDGGLDGWFFDNTEQLFNLHQVKCPDNPTGSKVGPEPIRELFTALDILSDHTTAYERSEKLGRISSELSDAVDSGVQVILNCIVFGELTEDAKSEFQNRCESNAFKPKAEIWDINRLYELYVTRETVEDLTGISIKIPIEDNQLIELEAPDVDNGIGRSLVVNLTGKDFTKSIKDHNPQIFGLNVRFHLGHQNRVNTRIKETIVDDEKHKYFWHYNNGITILVDDYDVSDNVLSLTNPQIVNGCQTVSTLINKYEQIPDKLRLLAKVIEVKDSEQGKKEALLISEATNSQSPVKVSDLKSNDPVQRQIQANFKGLSQPYHYERKRGEWKSLSPAEKAKFGSRRVNMIDIGQAWYSYGGNPAKAVSAKDEIFSDSTVYKIIYKKDMDVRLYLLSKTLFDLFNNHISVDNLSVIQDLVQDFDTKTLNRLVRGKKLVVAHCIALVKHLFDLRYGSIDGSQAANIINLIETTPGYKKVLLTLPMQTLKQFVANQPEDEDIRQKFKDGNTINELKTIMNGYLSVAQSMGVSLSDKLTSV